MELDELREKWENHKEVELEIVKHLDCGYKVIYVICTDGIRRCWLYRYFEIGEDWHISVEIDDATGVEGLRKCFKVINDSFEELLPE